MKRATDIKIMGTVTTPPPMFKQQPNRQMSGVERQRYKK